MLSNDEANVVFAVCLAIAIIVVLALIVTHLWPAAVLVAAVAFFVFCMRKAYVDHKLSKFKIWTDVNLDDLDNPY